ncbi:hypothetical protein GE115_06795 [Agromyces sp. CFH 90414]|uniref:Uncharacterized protein n=1 Tax=Agromyces agglutinans TaxID=2662258 RepID=A0A6I2FEV6_9MICO|nr:hypothetical protein [Agromyces agglutinans]MRG59578.1 hypothetical protein [Agromyces agglutinans]
MRIARPLTAVVAAIVLVAGGAVTPAWAQTPAGAADASVNGTRPGVVPTDEGGGGTSDGGDPADPGDDSGAGGGSGTSDGPPGGGTGDGGTQDGPDDGRGFDLSVSLNPQAGPAGGSFTATITVRNMTATAPANASLLGVEVKSTYASAKREPASSCPEWVGPPPTYPVRSTPTTPSSGDHCLLSGLRDPGGLASFTVTYSTAGIRPPLVSKIIATVAIWRIGGGDAWVYSGLHPLNRATDSADRATGPLYTLSVFGPDLTIGAPDGEELAAIYQATTTEAAMTGLNTPSDVVGFVLRLSWPDGLIRTGEAPPGCEADGSSSLLCTVDPANRVPTTEQTWDDEFPRLVMTHRLTFVHPTSQTERERLGAFTLGMHEGWYFDYVPPRIAVAPTPSPPQYRLASAQARTRVIPAAHRAAAPAARPPGLPDLPPEWVGSASSPYAILDRVFPTTTAVDEPYAPPGGEATAVFTVTHAPDVTTTLPGVRVAIRLDWPSFLEPIADPAGCAEYFDGVCTMVGLDQAGASVEISMSFRIADDAEGTGWLSASSESVVVMFPSEDGVIPISYPDRWIEYSEAPITVIADVFVTQVTLDRDRTWPGGEEVLATVRVQWAKALPDARQSRVFVSLELGWDEGVAELVEPPGIDGCAPLEERVCTLQDWTGPGEVKEVTFRLDPSAVGRLDVTATPVFIGLGVPRDASELPLEWFAGDEVSATVLDARFDVDLVLDRNPIYHGGLPLRAHATLTRTPATDGGPGYVPTLPNADAELVFEWPDSTPAGQPTTHLTLGSVENCPGFAVDTCVKTGVDAVGATADTTLAFAPPAAGAPHDPLPAAVSVTVERASFDVTTYTLPPLPPPPEDPDCDSDDDACCDPESEDCCEPGTPGCPVDPMDEPIVGIERVDVPGAWLGEDAEPYTLLQPVAWFSPAVANPGDVVTVFGRYFPPGETTNVQWELQHAPATPSNFPTSFVAGPLGTDTRRDIVVFRRSLQGSRWAVISSPLGTFGTVDSSPVLITPRSSVGPDLVGRGG